MYNIRAKYESINYKKKNTPFSDAILDLCARRDRFLHLDASGALKALAVANPSYQYEQGRQEDAHEAFVVILNTLSEELWGEEDSGGLNYSTHEERTFECLECENISDPKRESCIGFSVDLRNEDGVGLEELVLDYFRSQTIERKCQNCSSQRAKLHLKLYGLPSTLMIHLKRFTYDFSTSLPTLEKQNTKVRLPTVLHLDKFLNDSAAEPMNCRGNVQYRLRAVVRHSSQSANYGHYVCDINSFRDVWYHYNDSVVSKANKEDCEQFHGREGYILFYEAVQKAGFGSVSN